MAGELGEEWGEGWGLVGDDLYGTDRSSGYSEKQGEKKGRTVLRGDEGMEEVNASK